MPMITCQQCGGTAGGWITDPVDGAPVWLECSECGGIGGVPDDFFPEELLGEDPEQICDD